MLPTLPQQAERECWNLQDVCHILIISMNCTFHYQQKTEMLIPGSRADATLRFKVS